VNQSVSKSRRQFLKGAGMAGFATTLAPQHALAVESIKHAKAKNLIFLVVDGMCSGTLSLAHHWNLRNHGKPLNWMQLYQRADLRKCTQDTASLSSPVTDSAAAASAWGSGQRVNNGSINVAPDGQSLTPLFVRAKQAGKRTGLVSTCRISHATPAGFAVSVKDRNNEDAIVRQYLELELDLLLGGGAKHFKQSSGSGGTTDYFKAFEDAGYITVRGRDELKRLPQVNKSLLGIFSDSHIPYAIDRQNDSSLAGIPDLPEMFAAALNQLHGSKEGFVLQVEGGRVDHAGHANDPGAILHEQLEFDSCIPTALDFIEKHPDTLLIVTTDHGTGGCQLNGQGRRYNDSGPALDRINQFRYSFEWLEQHFKQSGNFDSKLFTRATGITATAAQAAEIQKAIKDPNINYLNSTMTKAFVEELSAISATGWTSNNHTAENVELLAMGPGSQKVPAFIRNNELFGIMTDALRI